MSSAETLYMFREQAPDVLQRERDQTVSMEAYEGSTGASVLAAPTEAGSTFSLLHADGTVVIDAQPVVVPVSGSLTGHATYAITAAELPDTLALSEMYQERWALIMPDTTTRTVRREAAVTLYQLHLPITTIDLTVGYYPNLTAEVVALGGLQQFIDTAWYEVLQDLWSDNRWPDIQLSTWAFVKPVREKAFVRTFAALDRNTGGTTGTPSRWSKALERHEAGYAAAWAEFRSRVDYDHDGLPDEADMDAMSGAVHVNAHRVRRVPRADPRF